MSTDSALTESVANDLALACSQQCSLGQAHGHSGSVSCRGVNVVEGIDDGGGERGGGGDGRLVQGLAFEGFLDGAGADCDGCSAGDPDSGGAAGAVGVAGDDGGDADGGVA